MSRGVLHFVLLTVLLGSLALHALAGRDFTRRNVEFFPDMGYSPAYDSYTPNPNFPDGKTLQAPEPGTIPHGRLPLHYGPSFEDFLRAGDELHNPFPGADRNAGARGAFVFANYCQMCHGPGGKGDGLLVRRGIPPAASLLADNALRMKDGEMFHVISYGRGNMAAQAGLLSREDRWKVILHIRSLQKAAGEKKS